MAARLISNACFGVVPRCSLLQFRHPLTVSEPETFGAGLDAPEFVPAGSVAAYPLLFAPEQGDEMVAPRMFSREWL